MELFARVYAAANQATMLVSGRLRCVHVSTHYSLRAALDRITRERVLQRIVTTCEDFRRWGMARPRIAVSAVNPHGGEGGLMGSEEVEHLVPSVADARFNRFANTCDTPLRRAAVSEAPTGAYATLTR